MADEEKKPEGDSAEAPAKQPMMSKMGIIVVVVFLLIYTGGLVFLLDPNKAPAVDEDDKPEPKPMKTLGTFVKIEAVQVNITTNPTTGATRLMNIQVEIEVNEAGAEPLGLLQPWVRSQLIDIVSAMEYRQLAGPDARGMVKSKLSSAIQKRLSELGEGKVNDVMIVSFMFAG